jgi:DNA-binding MarR family transcriptional regulator
VSGRDGSPTREEIKAWLNEDPGARPSDVADAFDLHPSTADYHLRRLAERGAIVRERVGRELHHYPHGEGWCQDARAVHARLTAAGRAVIERLLDRGLVSRRAIVARGHSRSATRWAIDKMSEAGVIERAGWGIYEQGSVDLDCATAALREEPCPACNDVDQPTRPTSNPSPKGKMVASRFD